MALAHHNLVVWQRADDLFIELHLLTRQRFPAFERFELGSQVRRAAYSVPANLVEGIARTHPRESLRFFDMASSSLSEVGYGIHAATRLGYFNPDESRTLEEKVRLIAAPLKGLAAPYRERGGLQRSARLRQT